MRSRRANHRRVAAAGGAGRRGNHGRTKINQQRKLSGKSLKLTISKQRLYKLTHGMN